MECRTITENYWVSYGYEEDPVNTKYPLPPLPKSSSFQELLGEVFRAY